MPSGTSVKQPVYVVDAFAERPFVGNPAAVCPLKEPVSTAWMTYSTGATNMKENSSGSVTPVKKEAKAAAIMMDATFSLFSFLAEW